MSQQFYIQNGYVGNAMAWWAKGSAGYTTDIEQAEKYSEAEAQAQVNCRNGQDRAYPCELIDGLNPPARKTIIDGQYVDPALGLQPQPK